MSHSITAPITQARDAYQLALANGFIGTLNQWLESQNEAATFAAAASDSADSATASADSATTKASEAATSASNAATSETNAAAAVIAASDASRLTAGTATTGAPGSSVAVAITGSAGAQVLNLTVPQGPIGATGAQGTQGIQGIQGVGPVTIADLAPVSPTDGMLWLGLVSEVLSVYSTAKSRWVIPYSNQIDPAAAAYIALVEGAGASVSLAQKFALDVFIRAEKIAGRWNLHKRLYLPIWANATANAICMRSLTSGTFVDNVTHSAGFVRRTTGQIGSFDTLTAPNSIAGISPSSGYLFGLSLDDMLSNQRILSSRVDASADWNLTVTPPSIFFAHMRNLASPLGIVSGEASPIGIISGSREGGNRSIYRRAASGRSVAVTEAGGDQGSTPNVNVINNLHPRTGAFGFGLGLTNAQDEAFTLNLKTLWETATGLTLP